MALFSISNGYIGNIGFMFAPKVVASEYQDVAAAFTVAMLVGGCGVGSVISNSIVKMLWKFLSQNRFVNIFLSSI